MSVLKVLLDLDGTRFFSGLTAARQGVQRFGKHAFGELQHQIAAAFTIGAITEFGRRTMDYADNIDKMSTRIGIAADKLQEFKYAATQSGASMEQLVGFVEYLSRAAADPKNAAFFNRTGVSRTGTPEEMLRGVAGWARGRSSAEVASELGTIMDFRKVGAMINFLQSDLEVLGKQARNAGAVMDESTVKALSRLSDQMEVVSQILFTQFGPAILEAGKAALRAFSGVKGASGWWGARTANISASDVLKALVSDAGKVMLYQKWKQGEDMGLAKEADDNLKKQGDAMDAMIKRLLAYEKFTPPNIKEMQAKGSQLRGSSDPLLSVGNFLGSRRDIATIAAETNKLLTTSNQLLSRIAEAVSSNSGETIDVP